MNTATQTAATIRADRVSRGFVERVPIEFAREHLVISQGEDDAGNELLAMSGRGADAMIAHNVGVRLDRPCIVECADAEAIATALDELATRLASSAASTEKDARNAESGIDDLREWDDGVDIEALLRADDRDLLAVSDRAPIVKLVNGLLFEALRRRASDVHIQPEDNHEQNGKSVETGGVVVIRYRVDGVLVEARRLPMKFLLPIVSRVKVMASMDVAERRVPQDGRAAVTIAGRPIDLRVSSLPTAAGERVVIRLLDKRDLSMFRLDALGMPGDVRACFERICTRPHGIVLVTGPTGSGKTTTLYAVLRLLNATERNIMTIEDPIEYELAGISQSQVNLKKGVNFSNGLRHILRQDPDVIMVGEIRDTETARVAIQSSLTGHLVFSTLHTNSAASAVTRLVDLGVEPYLLNASLAAVLAQRLVRTLCTGCKGAGCEDCSGTGFRGRVGLFELLVMNDALRSLVASGASASRLHAQARTREHDGEWAMRTLKETGLDAVRLGRTTRQEVERVCLMEEAEFSDSRDSDEPTHRGGG
ncbi:MAG: Flp pilus assembly complex ATPase component TadA [Phycisphaeraceae bacterium]|nr:Flp pilus assembly complex ATPase component TadA [Phycisphaerales bacterium]MCB9842502.1 Flp pilus assembly complex ATPase component TadA [Phycisphaeraceae bacterium]